MARGLLGKKVGMSQVFDQEGNLVPVTVLEMGPNQVLQVKTKEGKDGYNAIKVGYGDIKPNKLTRPEAGVFRALNLEPRRHVQEFRVADDFIGDYSVGDELTVGMFQPGQKVDVTGTSKGKGFQGVIKRHGFKGAKESSHGTHEYRRHGGSIGASAYPGRVMPGRRMAGHTGSERVTVRAITVVAVFPEQNLLLVRGAVPGAKGAIISARVSSKQPKFLP